MLTASQIIDPMPGTYTIAAAPVVVGNSTYHATLSAQTITVASGIGATATVDYFNIIPNTTKILDQTGAQSLIVSADGSTLTISSASQVAASLQPGDVLVIAPVTAAPTGMLVKVVTATLSGSTVTVVTTPATLADEVTQAQFSVDIPLVLSGNSAASTTHALSGFRTNYAVSSLTASLTNPCAGASQWLSLPFNYSLEPDQNQNTLTASGEVDFCNLHVDFELHPLSLMAKGTISLQQYSTIVVQGKYSASFDWSQSLDPSDIQSQVACLGNETCQDIQGLPDSIGHALEVVTPTVTPLVGMTGSASGGLYFGGAESGSFQAGMKLQGVTASPIYAESLQAVAFPTAADGTLDAKGYFGFEIGLQLLGSVNFHVDPRIYADLQADTGANPWWNVSLGDEAMAGMTIGILGFGNSEHDTAEYTIYSGPLTQANGPYAGQPTLASLTPVSATQNSPALTLSLTGTNFVPGCYASLNGTPLSTTYSDPTSLTAQVPASLLGSVGSFPVTVTNSNATGTVSNALPFAVTPFVTNPVPAITQLNPASVAAGSPAQTLTINGTGFITTSTVQFNGITHAATLVGASQITISLTTADLATAGTYPVVVTNLSPGGGPSAPVNFTVTSSNPVPTITLLNPASLPAGSAAQMLTINGTGFLASSSVEFNNIVRAATFISASQLTISLTTADLATAGTYPVVVTNPSPGGGPSAPASFTVSSSTPPVTISPFSVSIPENSIQTFSADVSGGGSVTWSVEEGAAGGTITSAGIYTAPSSTGTFHVVATNSANAAQSATATVTVIAAVSYSVLYSFPYAFETAPLIEVNGTFYGTNEMIAFKVDSAGNLSEFAALSSSPNAPISPLLASNGNFYGTTGVGGASGLGSIFMIDASGNVTTLYYFDFTYPGATNGAWPWAGLIQGSDGNFYGTTYAGGDTTCEPRGYGVPGYGPYGYADPPWIAESGCGTVFRMDTSNTVTALYAFSGQSDGNFPMAPLIQGTDGNFYGTTTGGGAYGYGTVFKLVVSGNSATLQVLHAFNGTDGNGPVAGLLKAADGNLYGTPSRGGASSDGVIFKVATAGEAFSILHSFSGSDGLLPVAPLIQGSDGSFYGTTWAGGDFSCGPYYYSTDYPYPRLGGCGTVFRMDSAGNVTVLHVFEEPPDGNAPYAGLLFGSDGNLYGTTYFGGTSSQFGTIFRIILPSSVQ